MNVLDEILVLCCEYFATLSFLDVNAQVTLNDRTSHNFLFERFQCSLSGDFEEKKHNLLY